jgi:hypothetical protein
VLGEFALDGSHPVRLSGVEREASQRWRPAHIGAERVRIFDAFDKGGGLFALARLEAPRSAWVDGLLFCAGTGVRARRLYEGPVLDARLVALGTDHALVTLHRDGEHQVLSATWVSSDLATRGPPRALLRERGLTLLGADVAPSVRSFLLWYARPDGERSELRVASFALAR